MSITRFQTAAVIGSGMMGPGIAGTLALGGVRTTILSRTEVGAKRGLEAARHQILLLEEHGLVEPENVARALDLLDATTEFDATVARVDLVIESAPEEMEFKQKLFGHMDAIAKPDAVLASNTSGLSITAVAANCLRPDRVLTTHFWNPPHLMPLVEIVRGDQTSADVASSIRELLTHCGKTAVMVKKDRPGQLGNRLQMALVREAVNIVAEGIADVEDVDTAVRNGFGLRLPAYGIFEQQDMAGLDLGLSIVDYVSHDLFNGTLAPELFRSKVAADELGVKTGKGFYDWSHKSADEVRTRRDSFLLEFLKSQKGRAVVV